jgi:hypothetical protein
VNGFAHRYFSDFAIERTRDILHLFNDRWHMTRRGPGADLLADVGAQPVVKCQIATQAHK